MNNAKVVDEYEAVKQLVDNVEGAKGTELAVGFVFLEVGKGRYVLEEGLEAWIEGSVGPKEVKELLQREVTELHLDTEAGESGAVSRTAHSRTGHALRDLL